MTTTYAANQSFATDAQILEAVFGPRVVVCSEPHPNQNQSAFAPSMEQQLLTSETLTQLEKDREKAALERYWLSLLADRGAKFSSSGSADVETDWLVPFAPPL